MGCIDLAECVNDDFRPLRRDLCARQNSFAVVISLPYQAAHRDGLTMFRRGERTLIRYVSRILEWINYSIQYACKFVRDDVLEFFPQIHARRGLERRNDLLVQTTETRCERYSRLEPGCSASAAPSPGGTEWPELNLESWSWIWKWPIMLWRNYITADHFSLFGPR